MATFSLILILVAFKWKFCMFKFITSAKIQLSSSDNEHILFKMDKVMFLLPFHVKQIFGMNVQYEDCCLKSQIHIFSESFHSCFNVMLNHLKWIMPYADIWTTPSSIGWGGSSSYIQIQLNLFYIKIQIFGYFLPSSRLMDLIRLSKSDS